jgi:hypothetical protein
MTGDRVPVRRLLKGRIRYLREWDHVWVLVIGSGHREQWALMPSLCCRRVSQGRRQRWLGPP